MVYSHRPIGPDSSALGNGLEWLASILPATPSPVFLARHGSRSSADRWSVIACHRLGALHGHSSQASAIGEGH